MSAEPVCLSDLRYEPRTPHVGGALDEWVLDRLIGQGGDGAVYQAHHVHDARAIVALKLYPHDEVRLGREVAILRSIRHPNIVTVHHARLDGQLPYLVLERVDGPTLAQWMTVGPMDPGRAADLFRQAVAAVAYLHARGITHRDIKPSNFVFDRITGRLVLIDFGHVHATSVPAITSPDLVFGTVHYAAPECGDIHTDDAQADVYALGVVLHEMLIGEPAFRLLPGLPQFDQIYDLVATKRAAPLDPGDSMPPRLRAFVRHATAPDPRARYRSAVELERDVCADPTTITLPRRRAG